MAPAPAAYRPTIHRLTRAQLEDAYYQLYDQNKQIKITLNDTQQKLKIAAAKLMKALSGKTEHDIDHEEMEARIRELDRENRLLRNKLQSAKHQLATFAHQTSQRRHRPHSQQSTIPPQTPSTKRPKSDVREETSWTPTASVHHPAKPEQTAKIKQLETTVDGLNEQLLRAEQQIKSLQSQLTEKQLEQAEQQYQLQQAEMANRRQETVMQQITGSTQEETYAEITRLQRLLRDKTVEVGQTEMKLTQIEHNMRTLKHQHDQLLLEHDQLHTQLRTEQNRNTQLQQQVEQTKATAGAPTPFTHELETVRRENQVLKEANEKFMSSAFNIDREKSWFETERQLRARITELEQTVKSNVTVRNEILEKMAAEIAAKDKAEDNFRKLEISVLQLKAEVERMEKRQKALLQGGLTWSDIEMAVASIRQQRDTNARMQVKRPEFLIPVQDQEPAEIELDRIKVAYAGTVAELEKTRHMLITQHKINVDYQAELDTISRKSEHQKREYERELKRYAELLDQRALRIQRLESSLHDIAYGKRRKDTPITSGVPSQELRAHAITTLEPGQNMVEIKLAKITLGSEALKWMQSSAPSFFLTVEFFDFEIQFTPIVSGSTMVPLEFTCEYAVMMSDLFLHYMETESATIELHQASGTNYKTWAAGALHVRDLLRTQDGMLMGQIDMIGVAAESMGVVFAKLDYAVHMKVPLEKAIGAYKERALALGYLLDDRSTPTKTQTDDQTNQLIVCVHRCSGLKSKIDAKQSPSPYVVYNVFDMADHDTKIVLANISPQFDDEKVWTLPLGGELNDYLKTQSIRMLVFDDVAESDETALIGVANVALVPLVHNKQVKGEFQLQDATGAFVGSIDVSIHWKFTYIPPKSDMIVTQMMVELEPEKSQPTSDRLEAPAVPQPSTSPGAPPVLPVVSQPITRPKGAIAVGETVHVDVTGTADSRETQMQPPIATQPSVTPPKTTKTAVTSSSEESTTEPETSHKPVDVTEKPTKPSAPSFDSSSESVQTPTRGSRSIAADQLPKIITEITPPSDEDTKPEPPARSSIVPLEPIVQIRKPGHPIEEPTDEQQSDKMPPIAAPRRPKVVGFADKPEIFRPPADDYDEESDSPSPDEQSDPVVCTVSLSITQLQLTPKSPLLSAQYDDAQVFVQWEFLGLDEEECQTEMSLYLPRDGQETVDFQMNKEIPLTSSQITQLRQMVDAGDRIRFELLRDPGDVDDDNATATECEELAIAELLLRDVWNSARNVSPHKLLCKNVEGQDVCTLELSFGNLDQLRHAQ